MYSKEAIKIRRHSTFFNILTGFYNEWRLMDTLSLLLNDFIIGEPDSRNSLLLINCSKNFIQSKDSVLVKLFLYKSVYFSEKRI